MELYLPDNFETKIKADKGLSGALYTLMGDFSDWLKANNTEFFPEYTDHGIEHVQSVLNTAAEIISDESWEVFTKEDVYVLTLSILLHDCAMHISREGLWNLIDRDTYNGVLFGFENDEEWLNKWKEFKKEVERFDEHDYIKFFGEYRDIKAFEVRDASLSDDQKVIIGDFVRRHHAHIAQVISTYGIPSKSGPIQLFDNSYSSLNQLSGLIARSHNYKLRDVVDLLGEDRKRVYRNTHPTYLMGLLRIADYLQLKSDRTPKLLFKTIAFCSPVSIKEWKKHLAVISTNAFHPDEELLFIEAFPDDASTLVGIKKLLFGLQTELDEYWAVTGEVYSRFNPLNKLSIKYRRVKSNIDNPKEYVKANHKNYYPEVLTIKSDNQKLLPLLIKPLYGDFPQIGLRELLQNALDATNERYSEDIGKNVNTEDIPYEITIHIDLDKNTFTLSDQGMGMSSQTIKDYFLKVGSSYRASEQWKSKFQEGNTSKIPRTGRFGIGMLAGFLIGDRIEIKTRHKDSTKGVVFSYRLDSSEIELEYIQGLQTGTTITVYSDNSRLQKLIESLDDDYFSHKYRSDYYDDISSWWYFLDSPNVIIKCTESESTKLFTGPYEITKKELLTEWHEIKESELDSFYWRHNREHPRVLCNGIVIQKMNTPEIKIDTNFDSISFTNLEICLFDNNSNFPLNLTRTQLITENFYEISKLSKSVKENFIKELLFLCKFCKYEKNSILNIIRYFVIGFGYYSVSWLPLIFGENQVIFLGDKKQKELKKEVVVDFIMEGQNRGLLFNKEFDKIKNTFNYSCFIESEKKSDTILKAINYLLLNRKKLEGWSFQSRTVSSTNQDLQAWIYVKEYDFNKINEDDILFIDKQGLKVTKLGEWIEICKFNDSIERPEIVDDILSLDDKKSFIFAVFKSLSVKQSEFSKLCNEYND